MGLTKIAVTRPVFMIMVISALALMGAISFTNLNQELFPSINAPTISITTLYAGASPEDVETFVTKPIEDAVAGMANVSTVQSTSSEGRSSVTVTFNDKANTDLAAVDVERRLSAIRSALPIEAGSPSITKFDPSSQASLQIGLSGARSAADLFDLADDLIRPQLLAVDGVGQVTVRGGLDREIQVQLDPRRLSAYGLNFEQVVQALQSKNVSRPAGSITDGGRQTSIRLTAQLTDLTDIELLVITNVNGVPVLIRDVAEVVPTTKSVTTIARVNGENAVVLDLTRVATANEIRMVDAARATLQRLERQLPQGVRATVIVDRSSQTRASLAGVESGLLEAIAITGIVLLLFLHTYRSTVIVLFAIPTSLLTTLLWMNVLGFTLNIMSMLALVLVIGVLVDDSIVVIENIVRHLGLKETPFAAALNGRAEIGLAAIAITLVDVVIFTPVAFTTGFTSGFFRQFGLVVAAATLTSLFISFTLTPMLASRWLNAHSMRPSGPLGWFGRRWDAAFEWAERGYRHLLVWALRWRWLPPLIGLASVVAAIALISTGRIRVEFVPTTERSDFSLSVELPAGASLDSTDQVLAEIEKTILTDPDVATVLSIAGATSGFNSTSGARFGQMTVVLKKHGDRHRGSFAVINDLKPKVAREGVIVNFTSESFGGTPIQYRITGQNRADIEIAAARVEDAVRSTPGTTSVTNSALAGNPETRLSVDRRRLADYGLTPDQVANALRNALTGIVATKLQPADSPAIDVRVIANDLTRGSVNGLETVVLTVPRDGQPIQVRIGQVTTSAEALGPSSISRRNRQPQATVSASLVGNTPLSQVSGPLSNKLAEIRRDLPPDITIAAGGQAEQQADSFGQLILAMGLSLILVYMLLAALYESFIMPLATMFALPMALIGAFGGLAMSGNTLNLLTMIGMIVLMGLVGKNGILLIDFTNTLRARGLSRNEALQLAGPTRLRPILMTTAALVFGMLPIALGTAEGSELYRGIGWLMIGGMMTSTGLSLIVVPAMYTYFDDLQTLVGRVWRWRPIRRRPQPPSSIEPDAVAGVA